MWPPGLRTLKLRSVMREGLDRGADWPGNWRVSVHHQGVGCNKRLLEVATIHGWGRLQVSPLVLVLTGPVLRHT